LGNFTGKGGEKRHLGKATAIKAEAREIIKEASGVAVLGKNTTTA